MMPRVGDDFLDVRAHGFARVAVCVPETRVADPAFNAAAHLRILARVHAEGAHYALCPELGLSAYTCADLFFQEPLLAGTLAALARVAEAPAAWSMLVSVGAPLVVDDLLFNCAVTLYRGRPVAAAPKAYAPDYRAFYELAWFHPPTAASATEITLRGLVWPGPARPLAPGGGSFSPRPTASPGREPPSPPTSICARSSRTGSGKDRGGRTRRRTAARSASSRSAIPRMVATPPSSGGSADASSRSPSCRPIRRSASSAPARRSSPMPRASPAACSRFPPTRARSSPASPGP